MALLGTRTIVRLLSILSVMILPWLGTAAELKGVVFDDSVKVSGTALELNGLGVRKAFSMFEVYVAGLYVPQKSKDPAALIDMKGPKQIVLKFKRFVEKGKMREAWTEGFLKNADKTYSYREDLKKLNEAMTSHLKESDVMTFTFFEDRAEVQVKSEPAVSIPGAEFSKTMFKVFLGNPPDESLKRGLLGL